MKQDRDFWKEEVRSLRGEVGALTDTACALRMGLAHSASDSIAEHRRHPQCKL